MEQPVTAVYDANILYPAPLRDLFIRLAQAGLVRARWTETIHEDRGDSLGVGSLGSPCSCRKNRFHYFLHDDRSNNRKH